MPFRLFGAVTGSRSQYFDKLSTGVRSSGLVGTESSPNSYPGSSRAIRLGYSDLRDLTGSAIEALKDRNPTVIIAIRNVMASPARKITGPRAIL